MARKRKILLLEDDPLFLGHVQILLGDPSFELTVSETVEECLAKLEEDEFDCAVMDFHLPDGTSEEVLMALKGKSTAAIIVTARDEKEVIKGAFKAGAFDYVPKTDVNKDVLVHLVRKACQHSDLLREVQSTRVELEHFVRTAAHDLKTPLSSLHGHLFLLQMAIDSEDKEEMVSSMQEIEQAGEDMANLIDALLEYTRVGWHFNPSDVDLNPVMEIIQKRLDFHISESNATIEIEPQPIPMVKGDRDLLCQLLQNLISNAIKYRGEEPLVIQLKFEVEADDPGVARIEIKDNGLGIDPSYHQAIFEPLERGDVTSQEGHGIGLATCKRIVEKHGGDIWVESRAGLGSTFIFTLDVEKVSVED